MVTYLPTRDILFSNHLGDIAKKKRTVRHFLSETRRVRSRACGLRENTFPVNPFPVAFGDTGFHSLGLVALRYPAYHEKHKEKPADYTKKNLDYPAGFN
jgi:hypothetical protein